LHGYYLKEKRIGRTQEEEPLKIRYTGKGKNERRNLKEKLL
jgi:hypothetical protein